MMPMSRRGFGAHNGLDGVFDGGRVFRSLVHGEPHAEETEVLVLRLRIIVLFPTLFALSLYSRGSNRSSVVDDKAKPSSRSASDADAGTGRS
jgi:hypothetical protein